MALLTASRPRAIAPGESVSPAARMATNADPQAITVTRAALRAATSVATATDVAPAPGRAVIAVRLLCYSTKIASKLVQLIGRGAGAATIASTVEAEVAHGRLAPATKLPSVRELAAALDVSPATVAAAYRALKQRGFVVGERGQGTSIAPLPPLRVKRAAQLPVGVRDLSSGNPDPACSRPWPRRSRASTRRRGSTASRPSCPL